MAVSDDLALPSALALPSEGQRAPPPPPGAFLKFSGKVAASLGSPRGLLSQAQAQGPEQSLPSLSCSTPLQPRRTRTFSADPEGFAWLAGLKQQSPCGKELSRVPRQKPESRQTHSCCGPGRVAACTGGNLPLWAAQALACWGRSPSSGRTHVCV